MVAAQTFHRDNLARAKILHSFSNGRCVAAFNLVAGFIKIMWATRGTGNGLRVKASIRRIDVVGAAMSVEPPRGHRSAGAVIGQSANDAVAWTAICTVDVGIVTAAIMGSEKLLQTLFAHRQVG